MSDKLKDILSNLNPDIDQETIMRYLEGKLSSAEQHEIEKGMMEHEFDSDALEGLQDLKDKKNISFLVDQLNIDLKKRTAKKNSLRKKLQLQLEPWLIITIVMILVLAIISFILVQQGVK